MNIERGRPTIEFSVNDWEQLDKLCEMQCTREEAAAYFDISIDTMDRRVKEKYGCTYHIYQQSKVLKGRTSLRRMQWQSAQKGNVQMQIWLGKQYLGQADKLENKQTNVSLADLIVERDVSPNVDKYVEPHRADQPRPIELKPLPENHINEPLPKLGSALDALLNSDKFEPKYFSHANQKEVKPFPDDDLDE